LGHKYSLILSRTITDEESAILQESGCYGANFVTDSLPTDPDVKVTKIDINDTVSSSLEKAIESGLDAVIQVPDLSVPGLRVPALPVEKKADQPAVVAGEVMDDDLSVGNEEEVGEANAKRAANGSKRAANGKAKAKRTANGKATAKTAESADDAKELSEAGTAAD
jgi:hypothetical protein